MSLILSLKEWAKQKRITIIRRLIAFFIFILLNSLLFGMFEFGRDPTLRYVLLPNASCRYIVNAPTYCYYYSLQQWLQGGYSTFYVDMITPMLIILLLIVALGRTWCSWACPFGLTQELLMSIRQSLRIPHLQLSRKWISLLDQLKYAVLFFTLLVAISIGIPSLGFGEYSATLSLPYCQICPAQGFFTLLQAPFGITSAALPITAIIVLVLFVVGSFFIRMFWCRICPMGALMALFNKLSLIWLRKDPAKCTKCRICLRVCPQDFHTVYEEMEKENITGPECTLCGRCVECCPEQGALGLLAFNKTIIESKPNK